MKLIPVFLIMLTTLCASAQKATYSLSFGGVEVGQMEVSQHVENQITIIEVHSKATISLGFKYEVAYTQITHYKKGQLIYADVKIYKNKELYNSSSTTWTGDRYEINHNGKKLELTNPINYSSTRLYFTEPSAYHQLFSESECQLRSIKKQENSTYRVSEAHSSRFNDYTYKNGIMQSALVKHSLINFKVKLTSYNP